MTQFEIPYSGFYFNPWQCKKCHRLIPNVFTHLIDHTHECSGKDYKGNKLPKDYYNLL